MNEPYYVFHWTCSLRRRNCIVSPAMNFYLVIRRNKILNTRHKITNDRKYIIREKSITSTRRTASKRKPHKSTSAAPRENVVPIQYYNTVEEDTCDFVWPEAAATTDELYSSGSIRSWSRGRYIHHECLGQTIVRWIFSAIIVYGI